MKKHLYQTLKITKKVIHVKLTIAVLLILPLVVVTLLTSKTDKLFGVRSMVVLSGSMEPYLPVGSVVYVQKSPTYTKGDVISFKTSSGITVTHRITDVAKEKFVTKGDANNSQDKELVASKDVIGKSIFVAPYLGYVIEFLRTPKGFVIFIIAPALIYIGFELWSVKKEIEKSVEKRMLEKFKMQQNIGVEPPSVMGFNP